MATVRTYKTLAQSAPGAASLTDAYTVAASTSALISSIIICNTSATPTAFRIAVRVAGLAITQKQYLWYDSPIGGLETVTATLGIGMQATDVVSVYNTLATCAFHITGVEFT